MVTWKFLKEDFIKKQGLLPEGIKGLEWEVTFSNTYVMLFLSTTRTYYCQFTGKI